MKKILLFTILLLLLLFPTHEAFANSYASSTIENHVNASSTNSNSQVTSHTDITVETDGKVTHYESDTPNQNVNVQSVNGASTIKVNGVEVSGTPTKENSDISPTLSPSPKPTETPVPTIFPQNKFKAFFEARLSFFKKFFDFLHSIGK